MQNGHHLQVAQLLSRDFLNDAVDRVVQTKAKQGLSTLHEWNQAVTAAIAWNSFALDRQRKAMVIFGRRDSDLQLPELNLLCNKC